MIYILNHAEVKGVIVDDALTKLIDAISSNIPNVKHFIKLPVTGCESTSKYIDFYELLDPQPDKEVEDVIINDRDVWEILYTSGTTAEPEGIMITNIAVFIISLTNAIEMKLFKEHVGTTLLPLFHCAQQTLTTSYMHVGAKTVVFRSFDPEELLLSIEREKINVIFALPAMYRAMLDHPVIKEIDLSPVERCIYAMTPMGESTLKRAIETFGADFMLGTGQTEFFPSINTFGPEWQLKKKGNYWGTSAITVDTAVMDDDGNLLPKGKVGEIVWRGPAVMKDYLKNEEATEQAWKYGWHHSGDLGYFDEDGLLVFVDRKKDMIKTGGGNVPSIKVEKVLLNHPSVEEAAVIGLPHERWIEAVTAFVKAKDVKEEELIEYCKKELAAFEVPKKIVFVNEFPKTATGKIQKQILREKYKDLYKNSN